MHLADSFLVHYLNRFDKYCFHVILHGKTYTVGEGKPVFQVTIHQDIPKKELLAKSLLSDKSIFELQDEMSDAEKRRHKHFYDHIEEVFEKIIHTI